MEELVIWLGRQTSVSPLYLTINLLPFLFYYSIRDCTQRRGFNSGTPAAGGGAVAQAFDSEV